MLESSGFITCLLLEIWISEEPNFSRKGSFEGFILPHQGILVKGLPLVYHINMMNDSSIITPMSNIKFKLADFLKSRGITRYKLGDEFKHKGNSTIYRLTDEKKPLTRIDLKTLADLMDTLEQLTDEDITFEDLLERIEDN